MAFLMRAIVAGLVIATASWLAGHFPTRAGYLVALPLSSMVVLPMAYLQSGRLENSFVLAKSILLAIPISVLFFLPFLLAGRLGLSFWPAYLLGCLLLLLGFCLHQWLARLLWTA